MNSTLAILQNLSSSVFVDERLHQSEWLPKGVQLVKLITGHLTYF